MPAFPFEAISMTSPAGWPASERYSTPLTISERRQQVSPGTPCTSHNYSARSLLAHQVEWLSWRTELPSEKTPCASVTFWFSTRSGFLHPSWEHEMHESINSTLGTVCSKWYHQHLPGCFCCCRFTESPFNHFWSLISLSTTLLIYSFVFLVFAGYDMSIMFEICSRLCVVSL